MKTLMLLAPLLMISFEALSHEQNLSTDKTPLIAEQAMDLGKSTGICAANDKLFQYASSTGSKDKIEFVKSFFAAEASDVGLTPQELSSLCKDVYKKSSGLKSVIDKYK